MCAKLWKPRKAPGTGKGTGGAGVGTVWTPEGPQEGESLWGSGQGWLSPRQGTERAPRAPQPVVTSLLIWSTEQPLPHEKPQYLPGTAASHFPLQPCLSDFIRRSLQAHVSEELTSPCCGCQ